MLKTSKTLGAGRFAGGLAGLTLLFVILVAVNILVANLRIRVDLTEEKLYTLSPGTLKILESLDQGMTAKLYFSESLADVPVYVKKYAREVEDLLREYALASNGKLRIEKLDPKPDSETEEWALRYGIERQPTGMFSPPMFFGLVLVGDNGNEEVLPSLSPQTQERLEYEISRAITRISDPELPVVGILGSLPVLGTPNPMPGAPKRGGEAWIAFRELRRDYTLRRLDQDTASIDPEIGMLILAHPKELPEQTLYAIDQFVLRGGKLLAMLDPLSVVDLQTSSENPMMMGMGGASHASDLPRLLEHWGVGYDPTRLVADMKATTRLGGDGQVEESPVFLSLDKSHFNAEDLLTAQANRIMLPFAGALEDNTGEELEFTPLITSSPDASCLVNAQSAMYGARALRSQLNPDGKQRVLAARLSGRFQTAFPDGPPAGEDRDPEEEPLAAPPEPLDSGESVVVVVADADFAADDYCVQMVSGILGMQHMQPINDNLSLLLNIVEQTSGRSELVAIRTRGRFARPFDRVERMEYAAAREWQAREEELNARLQETRQKLSALQNQRNPESQRQILSEEQLEAIEKFREQEADIRRQLREVRRNLRRDIERLGLRVKLANILLAPALVVLAGLIHGWRRRSR